MQKDEFGVSIVELLYSSNIVLLVGAGDNPNYSQRKLTIWTMETNSVLCETSFLYKIEAVYGNKSKIIAYVKDKIHIYNTGNMKFIYSLDLNYAQSKISLSPNSENNFLAYTNSLVSGTVAVFDLNSLAQACQIEAHKSSVTKVCINYTGNLLTTCSGKVFLKKIMKI